MVCLIRSVPRRSHRHLLPFGLRQFPVDLHAFRSKDLRVSLRRAVEHIEVPVQLPLKKPCGQFLRIGLGFQARLEMDGLQPVAQRTEVAVGIIYPLDGAQQRMQGRLAQLDYGSSLSVVQQLLDGVDRLPDAARPGCGLAVAHEVANSDRFIKRLPDCIGPGFWPGSPRGVKNKAFAEPVVIFGPVDDHPHQRVLVLGLEHFSRLGQRDLLGFTAAPFLRSRRAIQTS
jgi:hypothetical protein